MNIASARVDALVHRLARLTGEDIETALERAVQERLARAAPACATVDRRAALDAFLARAAAVTLGNAENTKGSDGFFKGGKVF